MLEQTTCTATFPAFPCFLLPPAPSHSPQDTRVPKPSSCCQEWDGEAAPPHLCAPSVCLAQGLWNAAVRHSYPSQPVQPQFWDRNTSPSSAGGCHPLWVTIPFHNPHTQQAGWYLTFCTDILDICMDIYTPERCVLAPKSSPECSCRLWSATVSCHHPGRTSAVESQKGS